MFWLKKAIKDGRGGELWNAEDDDAEEDKKRKANKKRHKDTDARWTKKGGQKHYGYKNHAKVDAKSKLIKKAVTTSAECRQEHLDQSGLQRVPI